MSTYDVNLSRRSVHVSGMTHTSVLGVTSDTKSSVLSIPLGLSREKIWRETLFLCLVQTTHGLICAFRIHGLGGFHPVPWYNSNCTKERSSRTIQVPGSGWNPPSPRPLKAPFSPSVVEVAKRCCLCFACLEPCVGLQWQRRMVGQPGETQEGG